MIKSLKLFGHKWKVTRFKRGSTFNFHTKILNISSGTSDPWEDLIHELCEATLAQLYFRYEGREGKQLFSMDHTEFSQFCDSLTQVLLDNDLLKKDVL